MKAAMFTEGLDNEWSNYRMSSVRTWNSERSKKKHRPLHIYEALKRKLREL